MKIRCRKRKDGTPSYSFVLQTMKAYEDCRQRYVNPYYKAYSRRNDPTKHRNWVHYVRAAQAVNDLEMSPEDYMETQFLESSKVSYPRPSNLYSAHAKKRAKEKSLSSIEIDLISINEKWLMKYKKQFTDLSTGKIVLLPWIQFSWWFRAYHGDDITEVVATNAKLQLKSKELLKELEKRNYNVDYLNDKIENVLEGNVSNE